ncbi:MAG: DinB family protein [Saprospiraceae bacterium]|nr:DinB family protein [Saprospiraceae bacterium]|tara:strand:- start:901 stop:1437 length:537 start_codon:yes stop_codon:yes gene_type:complete
MKFPIKDEYYPGYQPYIDLVKNENFYEQFDNVTNETIHLFKSISIDQLNYKYAENKWTIKEVLMHIIDTERGFSYRAIVCLRNDNKTPLYGMNEDLYAKNVDVSTRDIESMLEEFKIVRKGFRILFENCTDEQASFLGNGVDYEISARALGYISIGHTKHHLNVIRNKYLNSRKNKNT